MKTNPIIIVSGEPKSIFFEILFKTLKSRKIKSPIILITSYKILKSEMKKFSFKKKINLINDINIKDYKFDNKKINLIDIKYDDNSIKQKTQIDTTYIENCFKVAFKIIRSGVSNKFLNGPINKSTFLRKKHPGITEYISKKFKISKNAMLIYNKEISVCPLTTHLPIKVVSKMINKKLIIEKVKLVNDFFIEKIGFKPKIAVTGLNPHCESILSNNEDTRIISPAIKFLKKKGYKINGPYPADTIFLKQNRKKYNVIIGMYHDQVLSPIKTLKEYDAINITLGLPFNRVSPDHGPNQKMVNKNLSNPLSLIKSLEFLDQQ
tara:strand:- start:1655 stop:2617 length:963 start_codon:yes stop_codon:yes gene_type:complete